MDPNLMRQMNSGSVFFTSNVQLTKFPENDLITPGLGANPLYELYTSAPNNESVNVDEKKLTSELKIEKEDSSHQVGAGVSEPEAEDLPPSKKIKIDPEIFNKMMNPVFHVSKLAPKKESLSNLQSTNAASASQPKRKFHKF
jgi:hypothetical protein